MSIKRLFGFVVVACACVAFTSGCRTQRPKDPSRIPVEDVNNVDGPGGKGGGLIGQPASLDGKIAVTFENVLFEFDSAKVQNSEFTKMEAVATYLNGNSASYAVLEGHCDERGTAEYNMTLGERRADAVRAYLLGLKIDASRLHTKSWGKEKPQDQGHSEAAWRANRRVEFGLYNK
ncbi:MAG: OmpA family protein [bacterium]